jgi:predicted DNA-binding transcriptional regulator AlpA
MTTPLHPAEPPPWSQPTSPGTAASAPPADRLGHSMTEASETASPLPREQSRERGLAGGDRLVSVADIRGLFKLGRTAAYELTHRPGFPDPVEISPRCYRWWASEVDAFAATLRRPRAQGRKRGGREPRLPGPGSPPLRITGRARPARSRQEPP